jgi:class 3 adenylate cyclase
VRLPGIDRGFSRISALLAVLAGALGGIVAFASSYDGPLPALGGPNGLFYDLTLRIAKPRARADAVAPVVFVALDESSLARPELAAIPRALFQPVWARLIGGLLDAGARRIALDVVLAYAGADFQIGSFRLPEYDSTLVEALARGRERIVLGRFPSVAPARPFARAVGNSRVGVLDLQLESDGRVRSTGTVARLPDGRIALSFAALAAGLGVSEAASTPRILMTPSEPLSSVPTYDLAVLLDCLNSKDGADKVRDAVEGRVVVVGTAVPGEDEHRGPTRFLGRAPYARPANGCSPAKGAVQRAEPEMAPGALLQIAAIQSAAGGRIVALVPAWARIVAGASLALLFAFIASRDESALSTGERRLSGRVRVALQLARSAAVGLAGPVLLGCLLCAGLFIMADLWLPVGYPVVVTVFGFAAVLGTRWARHRALFRHLLRTAGRYLPRERLALLARSGFTEAPQGEEREVSILLADLVGFTAFSNEPGRTASEVVATANRYFQAMQAVIDRFGGCSDKFLGDAVLAFWNGLSDDPDHAWKALAAGRNIIAQLNAGRDPGSWLARVVVCSGTVYVGDLGARDRSSFTIIGPAVNETFRVEKLPDAYGVPLLVAASTVEHLLARGHRLEQPIDDSVLQRLDDVSLKGFSERRSVYTLVPRDDPGLARFQTARAALDQQRWGEASAQLQLMDRGMLQHAAKVLLERCPSPGSVQQTAVSESTH